jgi:hypothetical protein
MVVVILRQQNRRKEQSSKRNGLDFGCNCDRPTTLLFFLEIESFSILSDGVMMETRGMDVFTTIECSQCKEYLSKNDRRKNEWCTWAQLWDLSLSRFSVVHCRDVGCGSQWLACEETHVRAGLFQGSVSLSAVVSVSGRYGTLGAMTQRTLCGAQGVGALGNSSKRRDTTADV